MRPRKDRYENGKIKIVPASNIPFEGFVVNEVEVEHTQNINVLFNTSVTEILLPFDYA
jgi:hypothetical protein